MPHAHFDAQMTPNVDRKFAPFDRRNRAFCLGVPTSGMFVESGSDVSFCSSLKPPGNMEFSDARHSALDEVSATLEGNGPTTSIRALRTAPGTARELQVNSPGGLNILPNMRPRPHPNGDDFRLVHGGVINDAERKAREILNKAETGGYYDQTLVDISDSPPPKVRNSFEGAQTTDATLQWRFLWSI